MTSELRFDGRVAIVTGAGGGLGRSHALLLGGRGCRVVVNDLGGSMHGGGQSATPAEKVCAEIRALGGEAVASYDSVEDGGKIVQTAMDTWGRIDIVVNNAGILRDTSFQKISDEDWDLVYRVHVLGGFRVTRAAWNHMRDAGYGRIVFTASAAGVYGNFGQANYSMAKLGLVGLSNTLAIEGKRRGILVNTIAPIAGSRLTETILPKELVDALKPELVSPLVALLAHESCTDTGGLFEVGGGFFSKLRWERTEGKSFPIGRSVSPEALKGAWADVTDFAKVDHPADVNDSMKPVLANLQKKSRGGNELIDVDQALGYEFEALTSSYDERDVAIYALGIGAGKDPLDQKDLRHVYELHPDGFQPLPTFAVTPVINAVLAMAQQGKQAPGLNYGFERILHGEQYTEIKGLLPAKATLTHKSRIKDIWDKGKNAVIVVETQSYDESGAEIVSNEIVMVIRGAGGWGGDRGPAAEGGEVPARAPDATIEQTIDASQALLYRLSGDWNPLHADPNFAKGFGFPRPILHGLCTFGYAARHVLQAFCDNDARFFKSIRARFAESVFPGETIVTEMWKEAGKVVFTCKVKERDKVAIKGGVVELYDAPLTAKKAPKPVAVAEAAVVAAAPAAEAEAVPTSADLFAGVRFYVESHPELSGQVGTSFVFKLSSPASAWSIDLKGGKGSVTEGEMAGADVTLELSDADFMGMASGKLNPQKLYFGGKLKVAGNVMAAQKLEFLQKVDPEKVKEAMRAAGRMPAAAAKPAAAPAPAAPAAEAKPAKAGHAAALFEALGARLAKEPGIAAEIGAVIRFEVTGPDATFTVDARGDEPRVRAGGDAEAHTRLRLADEDLVALAKGASIADLHQRGRVRIDGDVRPAHKLGLLRGLLG